MRPLPVADRGNKYWCSGRNLSPLQGEINFGHRKLVAAERSASTFTLYRFIVFSKLNIYRGVAQFGRALRSGRRGRVFESRHLDQCDAEPNPSLGSALFLCGLTGVRL